MQNKDILLQHMQFNYWIYPSHIIYWILKTSTAYLGDNELCPVLSSRAGRRRWGCSSWRSRRIRTRSRSGWKIGNRYLQHYIQVSWSGEGGGVYQVYWGRISSCEEEKGKGKQFHLPLIILRLLGRISSGVENGN